MLHQSAPLFDPPSQRDATSVDPISNTKRFVSLRQESLSCPAIAHTRKNDLLEVATTLRSMMQYGGELVRRICSSKTDGRGAALPSLPTSLNPPAAATAP